ncbi:MAG TPA: Amuc_1098 family type IV pilus outer membrane protein [Chthoniobacterales bacterium]
MPSKAALLIGISTLVASPLPPLLAQQAGVQGAAEREIYRRESVTTFAQDAINKGQQALASKDYESAYAFYKSAVDALPSGGDASASLREEAMSGFGEAVILLSEQRISEGRYKDAETTVKVILADQYDPNYGPALKLLAKLQTPGTFNPTITPGFVASVEQVKQLLREGEGLYQSGRYDLAFKRCEQVLNIDKYNIAARRLMEKINGARQDYAENARNTTRSTLVEQVDRAWELPVTKYSAGQSQVIEQPVIDTRGTASLNRKLEEIRIPSINFREATVREALDYIKQRAKALDTNEPDPNKRGINIVLKLDPSAQAADSAQRITLAFTDVPLGAALGYVATAAGLKIKVEPYAVAVVPLNEVTDTLITKEYKVSPGFISSLPASDASAAPAAAGGVAFGAPATPAAGAGTVAKAGAKEFLTAQGVTFPPGSSANYLTSSSKLVVRNTQANLDLIDQLVDIDGSQAPTQVQIESKFVEITQNNLKELGFDWLLGQFQLPFGSGVYGGGGTTAFGQNITGTNVNTSGNTTTATNSAYPFQAPGSNGVPIGASSLTSGPVTAGNRSGSTAISVNAVDGLLFGSPAGAAPGVLALAGIFTNPQFQVVLRALDQQKGIDLMSAPRVTAKSGQRAVINLVREFKYPTQFDPPQIPQTVGTGFTPVTPTTPSAFDTRNLGVELEVEPTVGPDGYTIELNLSPRVTEFDGFINYGSPIYTSAQTVTQGVVSSASTALGQFVGFGSILGQPTTVLISENVINQPVFSVRQVTTQVTVYDGQTVVLGGLMREDVQKVEDKTPILGDIPLVGRLFRSSADQHLKRNLIMFVTANLLDPAGQPLVKEVEEGAEIAVPDAPAVDAEAIPGDPSTSDYSLPAK